MPTVQDQGSGLELLRSREHGPKRETEAEQGCPSLPGAPLFLRSPPLPPEPPSFLKDPLPPPLPLPAGVPRLSGLRAGSHSQSRLEIRSPAPILPLTPGQGCQALQVRLSTGTAATPHWSLHPLWTSLLNAAGALKPGTPSVLAEFPPPHHQGECPWVLGWDMGGADFPAPLPSCPLGWSPSILRSCPARQGGL